MSDPIPTTAVRFDWGWELAAPPEALWPFVSDTNRMNVLASMAPVSFTEAPNPDGGADRTGQTKQLGLSVTWEEHPFDWEYPRWFSVLREFNNGVLSAYRSSVTLIPNGTGTKLVHLVELVPRIGIMEPFVRREGPKQFRNWDHAYRAVDAHLTEDGPHPFEETTPPRRPPDLPGAPEPGEESPWVKRLFAHVLAEHAHELSHVRPYALADRWRIDRDELLVASCQAVKRSLMHPQWSLLCPHCRGAKGTVPTLAQLATEVYCNACNIHFGRVEESKVELTFKPDPRYRKVTEATYCVGGPGATPHILFQCKLAPGAGREMGLTIPPGPYRLRGSRVRETFDVVYHGPKAEPAADGEEPERPEVGVAASGFVTADRHFDGQKLAMRLVNQDDQPLDVVLESRDWRGDVVTLSSLREWPGLATWGRVLGMST